MLQLDEVDEVIMGTVFKQGKGKFLQGKLQQKAGIPWDVKTETINKVCASGMRSVTLGGSTYSSW